MAHSFMIRHELTCALTIFAFLHLITQSMHPLLLDFIANAKRDSEAAALTFLLARIVASSATDFAPWQDIASGMIQSGFAPSAAQLLNAAIQRFPDVSTLRYLRGNAQRLDGFFDAAEVDFRYVLQITPEHRDAALSLAYMLREQGRMQAAGDVIVASLQARSESADDTISALIFLRECGAHSRAHVIAQKGLARWPRNADIAALAAEFALAIGEFVVARECLHTTLDFAPDNSVSWLRLAYCQRFTRRDDKDFQRIELTWNNSAIDAQTHLCAGFAFGKALDDVGDYSAAASTLCASNALAHATTSWRTKDWRDFVEARLNCKPLPKIECVVDFAPIFVVGLPRTGTTLAATLLAHDDNLRERGELNWISAMYAHLVQHKQLHDPAALSTIAKLIHAQMRRDDAPARWYLDKNPLNFRYLDFIAALFPQARIIHCRRNPRDTALSLWMQHFAHDDLGFTYDFSTIAAFAQGHDRLMAHWRGSLDLPIFDLQYEALVTDPATALFEIAQSLGVSSFPNGASALSKVRAIVTASVWQVRQPVHTKSIGRWSNYAPYLPELENLY